MSYNGRKICEFIENNEFKNHEELASKITEMLKISIVELL